MKRLLVMMGLCVLFFTACKKADDPAEINSDQAAIDEKIITDYIAANGLEGVMKRVANRQGLPDTIGVWYQVLRQGPVATIYNPVTSRITVGYKGRVLNAQTPFVQTGDIHPSFTLGEVIRGWQVGITNNVNKGGTIRLLISSRYAYGPYAQPGLGLPANAILDFEIEVFDVTN